MPQKVAFLFICFLSLIACKSNTTSKGTKNDQVKYAKLLRIEDADTLTLVTILNPKTKDPEVKFALYTKSYRGQFPAGFTKIQVPVKRMAALSTTYIGMLNAIDGLGSVKATTDEKYIANKRIRKKIASGKILTSGYEHALTPESYLKAKINLIVFSGFGQPFPNEDKLAQLGITCLANYDWEESHPLGKAEWIKLFGALLDKQEEANAYFKEVETGYLKLKKSFKSKTKRKIIVGGMAGTTWNAPAGESFMAGMLRDAGIDYCYKATRGTASLHYTLEQVFKDQQDCSIWINAEGTTKAELAKLNPKFTYFEAYKSGKIYSYLHNPNYFWEQSTINPHWLLEDYMNINKGETASGKLHFYHLVK